MTRSTVAHFPGSFRDPSGFIFRNDGVIYRQVQESYADRYRHLIDSGLYDALVERKLLITHKEQHDFHISDGGFCILRPEQLRFISYPYEWSMSQLKDAALATLSIQETALSFGMTLKDASAYNIQFVDGHPTLIDTLSFDFYNENEPWVAYKQFCQHFMAPLALMKYVDLRTGMLLRLHIDGIPLDLASEMLPTRAKLIPAILLHIVIHSRFQRMYGNTSGGSSASIRKRAFPLNALKSLIHNLQEGIKSIKFPSKKCEWTDYYDTNNYSEKAFKEKERLVDSFLDEISPGTLWDMGANDGHFSLLASRRKITTIAMDSDPTVVERCYKKAREEGNSYLHPLLIDLTNPSPALGWAHEERLSMMGRGPADVVMALALIHHLAIGNNVPLLDVAAFLAGCGKYLIVEFVPKSDSQVQRMLSTREDVFPRYTHEGFEEDFCKFFIIRHKEPISESERTIYLMERI